MYGMHEVLHHRCARGYTRSVENEKTFQFQRTGPRTTSGSRPRAEGILRSLAEAGYSDTKARRAVVRALCGARAGATPADLLSRGRAIHAQLGQVTVYRTLGILSGLGLARRLHQEDGCSAYAVASRGHGHHVICRRCRRAVEFEGCSLGSVIKGAAGSTGYRVEGHWLELFGLCPGCQQKGRRTG
jgi:Fur family ferric uptake transcriptional regulator